MTLFKLARRSGVVVDWLLCC